LFSAVETADLPPLLVIGSELAPPPAITPPLDRLFLPALLALPPVALPPVALPLPPVT